MTPGGLEVAEDCGAAESAAAAGGLSSNEQTVATDEKKSAAEMPRVNRKGALCGRTL